MEDLFKKNLIQDTDYSKYLEELKSYYNLKNKYNSHKKTFINKLINSKDSLEVKKKLLSKQKFKCVNCGQYGGSIFFENNKILRATCGNTSSPCSLNLEIIKMTPLLINDELKKTNISLIDKKKQIVLTKLDFLFNYLEEDKAVELFDNLKLELGIIQEKYNNLISLYDSIVNNSDIKELIKQKLNEHDTLVNEYKEFIKLYNDTQEIKYLKDGLFLFTNKLKQLDEYINTLKYKQNSIESDEENKYLLQHKYTIQNLEVIKKPE